MKILTVNKNDSGQRLDKFLFKTLNSIPSSLLYKYFRNKCIKLNGKKCTGKEMICENDEIKLFIKDEFYEKEEGSNLSVQRLDLAKSEIAYEDENVLIVNKKAGETVHSGELDGKSDKNEIYLIDRICGYLFKKGEYDPEHEQSFAPALCNRIDKNTSGLVIAAKNAQSLRILNEKIKERKIKKTYLCACHGIFEKKSDTLSDFLIKNAEQNRVYIFATKKQAASANKSARESDIKTVITKYRVIGEKDGNSLLQVELITGRTHQIRAHLAYIGHPLLGDGKYGIAHRNDEYGTKQALCSHKLCFDFSDDQSMLAYLDGLEVSTPIPNFAKEFGCK